MFRYRPKRLGSFSLAAWAGRQRFANHYFANVYRSLDVVFLFPPGLFQFSVGSNIDTVALVIPAGSLIDGLEILNGGAELRSHGHFRIQFVRDHHFKTSDCF